MSITMPQKHTIFYVIVSIYIYDLYVSFLRMLHNWCPHLRYNSQLVFTEAYVVSPWQYRCRYNYR